MLRSGVLCLVLLAACADAGKEGPIAGGAPAVSIVSPQPGQGAYGGQIAVTVAVDNFTLTSEAIGEREGHLHVYLDGTWKGEFAEPAFTLAEVPSGEHTLEVRLATEDHTELGASASVEVPTRSPSVAITSPSDGAVLNGGSVPVALDLRDFTVAAEHAYAAPAFGRGFYQVLVDGVETDFGADPAGTEVGGLTEGAHTVTVALRTADGAPLDPPVEASVDVTVAPGSPTVAIDRSDLVSPFFSASIPVRVAATNAAVDYHLYLDGVFAQRAAGDTALLHVAPGLHQIDVRLVDGGSEMPIHDRVHVYVPEGRPDVRITNPGDQWGVPAAFELSASVEGVELDPDIGGAPVDGHGHWAVRVDGVDAAEGATGTAPLSGLPAGDHTLRVELRGNDRVPFDPPVYDAITVTVE